MRRAAEFTLTDVRLFLRIVIAVSCCTPMKTRERSLIMSSCGASAFARMCVRSLQKYRPDRKLVGVNNPANPPRLRSLSPRLKNNS